MRAFDLTGSLLYAIALFFHHVRFFPPAGIKRGFLIATGIVFSGIIRFSATEKSFSFIGYTIIFKQQSLCPFQSGRPD
jgi:hypothetical protein